MLRYIGLVRREKVGWWLFFFFSVALHSSRFTIINSIIVNRLRQLSNYWHGTTVLGNATLHGGRIFVQGWV